MQSSCFLLHDGKTTTISLEHARQYHHNNTGNIWLDILFDENDKPQLSELLRHFGCHELAISDALRHRHPPKIEIFKHHIFILYRGIAEINDSLTFDHQQIGFFISANILITLHTKPSYGIRDTLAQHKLEDLLHSPLKLALQILRTSTGIYLRELVIFEDEISLREDELYGANSESALTQLAAYKIQLIKLKRSFSYHKTIGATINTLSNEDSPFDLTPNRHQLNDLYDHLERTCGLAIQHLEICTEIVDSYISITSHKLNMTMRVLTIITAIFVPLSFLAGLYGMNFSYMPELEYKYSYPLLLLTMATITTSLFVYFRRKRWF